GILYRTRFDGSPWTGAVPSRRADLFNLTPGRHLLEVQSTDRYGRWVDNTLRVDIEVEPFWHETATARVVFMLLAIAIIWTIIYTYHYIRRVNRQRSELLEKYMTLLSADQEHHAKAVVTPLPDGNPEVNAFLERVRRFIEENIGNAEASVDDMAAAAAVSRSTLNRRLRSSLGISAAQLMTEARMQHAVILLGDGDRSSSRIAEIADMCGYSDPHYFQRVFARKYGCTPALYHDE
ncbi:MAG: helix-turn-helix transcriptional regulator, partial [Muribaculaceae bacterium]|nr:helix-turn-helix transcriptional regulator [Muribaculaceae bacterium]